MPTSRSTMAILVLAAMVLACSLPGLIPGATQTPPAVAGTATSVQSPQAGIAPTQPAAAPAATNAPPPTTPTGIPYVDAVIEAGQSGDPQVLKTLFSLRTVPCTTERWLLRQPFCLQGETDGTLVQTMPMLSSDLGHLRIDEINSWQGIGEAQLYAVYRTGSYTYSDEFFPAGEFAVAFLPEGSAFVFILQVTRDGIVRIDYCGVHDDICPGSTIEEIFQEHESEFILGPLPIVE